MSLFHLSFRSVIVAALFLCFMSVSSLVAQESEVALAESNEIEQSSGDTLTFAQSLYEPNISVSNFAEVYEFRDYVSVFPNLAVDCVNISIKESPFSFSLGKIQAEVRNLSGEMAHYSTFMGEKGKIDLHLLTPGLYILRLTTDDNTLIGSYEVKKFK